MTKRKGKIQSRKWACSFWFTWKSERNLIRNISKNSYVEHSQLSSCKCLDGFWQSMVLHSPCSCMTQHYSLEIGLSCCLSNLPPHRKKYFWFLSPKLIFHQRNKLTEHMFFCMWLIISELALGEMCTLVCVSGSFLFTDEISSMLISYHILFIVLLLFMCIWEFISVQYF